MSDDDKLHFVFVSLIAHDQQFYMAPSFASHIFKKDKKIVRFYQETEKNFLNEAKIKDFKKYKNYLLEEYSGKND